MTIDEYERLLKLSEMELYCEIHFDITPPKWIFEMYDYQMRMYNDSYRSIMVPRILLFNLDGV
jgi:hypothetical protein